MSNCAILKPASIMNTEAVQIFFGILLLSSLWGWFSPDMTQNGPLVETAKTAVSPEEEREVEKMPEMPPQAPEPAVETARKMEIPTEPGVQMSEDRPAPVVPAAPSEPPGIQPAQPTPAKKQIPEQQTASGPLRTHTTAVRIVCTPPPGFALPTIAGNGVVIDSRGVVLTSAHIAQYLLLVHPMGEPICEAYFGSARTAFTDLLFFPSSWVRENRTLFSETNPSGTGKHDWALALIDVPNGSSLRSRSYENNDEALNMGDTITFRGYYTPGQSGSDAITLEATIGEFLTFGETTRDVFTMDNIALLRGTSGSAVTNSKGEVIGIVATAGMSRNGAFRSQILTVGYIDRDLRAHSGQGIAQLLSGEIKSRASAFQARSAPTLRRQFFER